MIETIKDRLRGFDVYFPSKRYLLDTAVEWLHGFMALQLREKPHELGQGANSSLQRRGMGENAHASAQSMGGVAKLTAPLAALTKIYLVFIIPDIPLALY